MDHSTTVFPALFPSTDRAKAVAVLGAMRAIAETGGAPSDADRAAVASVDRYIFGQTAPLAINELPAMTPAALGAALAGTALAQDTVKFLVVMALVDGVLDKAKIAAAMAYAAALGVSERYLDDVTEAAEGRVKEAMADMVRANMESVTGQPWTDGDAGKWLLPYDDGGADPALAARFHALKDLDPSSFGHAFWDHFTRNGYGFPGETAALNEAFSIPHDSVHVLTGFDTAPRGELLASTFTAAMHPKYPMAGHILPVIFSWHLKLQINAVAGEAEGALDPVLFWKAWAAGAAAGFDTFDPAWDFWAHAGRPLAAVRRSLGVPEGGLDTVAPSGPA